VSHGTALPSTSFTTENIPEDLKRQNTWVLWRPELRDGRYTKVPYRADNPESKASSTDRSTWSDFDTAVAAARYSDAGIGFVLAEGSGLVGLDFDDCVADGTYDGWVSRLATYTEITPGGNGYRLLVYGEVPSALKTAAVEVYSHSRYLTITGRKIEGAPSEIRHVNGELTELYNEFAVKRPKPAALPTTATSSLSDDDLIQRILASKHETLISLWNGTSSEALGYPSDSEADWALLNGLMFWCSNDREQVKRLALRSGRVREKWHSRRGNQTWLDEQVSKVSPSPEVYKGRAPTAQTLLKLEALQGKPLLTQRGNAIRLARKLGTGVCFHEDWKAWLVWNGRLWEENPRFVHQALGEISRDLLREASEEQDKKRQGELIAWAKASEANHQVVGALEFAKDFLWVSGELFDRDPMLLNVENGTLDLRSGELLPHSSENRLTKMCPVEYDPEAEAPRWGVFLERILPNPDVRAFVQRAAGYSLTAETGEQCLFILYGTGANGKSTFVETMMKLLGDFALRTPTETLLAKRETGIPNDVARLQGARFVAASETEQGRRLGEAKIKELTGGDTIAARYMRAEWFDFRPVAKIWLSTNHRPQVRGTDEAIWRRIRLIPFEVTIPEPERNPMLPAALREELPGILNWALEGAVEWQRLGLAAPPAVQAATQEYRSNEDTLADFLAEHVVADPRGMTSAKNLFSTYKKWAETMGERPVSQKALASALRERGFMNAKSGHSATMVWRGIRLAGE